MNQVDPQAHPKYYKLVEEGTLEPVEYSGSTDSSGVEARQKEGTYLRRF